MKKLDISNYADLKSYQIQNWVIYHSVEAGNEYLFKLKRQRPLLFNASTKFSETANAFSQ